MDLSQTGVLAFFLFLFTAYLGQGADRQEGVRVVPVHGVVVHCIEGRQQHCARRNEVPVHNHVPLCDAGRPHGCHRHHPHCFLPPTTRQHACMSLNVPMSLLAFTFSKPTCHVCGPPPVPTLAALWPSRGVVTCWMEGLYPAQHVFKQVSGGCPVFRQG